MIGCALRNKSAVFNTFNSNLNQKSQLVSKQLFSLVLLLGVATFSCKNEKQTETQRGKTTFNVTGSNEALSYFHKGLLLLHSFEYDDAAEQFIKAREIDTLCIMAYWGEAMTYNHPLWSQQEQEEAIATLDLLGETEVERVAKAQTEIEKDFVKAVGIIYEFGDDKIKRDQAYAKYMEKLYHKYSGNHEVAAFYSLSLLGSVPEGRDVKIYEQAAEIAKEVLAENPEHPGALHYLIHSYDDPDHAALAVEVADSYSIVAPDAAHALHMPTHIYLALGMWNKVISSNIDSWEASKNRKARKELDNNALGYHAYSWLHYGMLQNGRFAEADSMLRDMITYTNELPSRRARSYLISMKGAFLIETENWKHEHTEINIEVDSLRLTTRTAFSFIEGMKYYANGNMEGLIKTIQLMNEDITNESGKVLIEGIAVCGVSSYSNQPPTQLSVDQSRIMEMELRALLAWSENDTARTTEWFDKATELEANISHSFGPPNIIKPSHELYGEWLINMNRQEKAFEQFNIALKRAPGRRLSEKGREVASSKM